MGKALRLVQTIEIQKDFQSMRQELKDRGYFDYSRSRLIWDFSRFSGLFAISLVLSRFDLTFLALIVLALTTIDVTWWIHDADRGAIFKSKAKAFWAIEAMGIFFLGMPQNVYHHFIHRGHHGSTNVLGRDLAPETTPTAWDASQMREGWKKFIILAALVARWIVFSILFMDHLSMIWIPATIAGFVLGFMASLNHFHLPIPKFPAPSFVGSVFERTQNVKEKGRGWTWISGGLNFHIEHHLFPDMPSRNYPKISRDVRIFARYHGLPYQEARAADIAQALTRKLKNPKSSLKIQT